MPSVARETVAAAVRDYDLPVGAIEQFTRLLSALAAEPDPHTTVSAPERALEAHVLDSLVALRLPAVREERTIVDIGAGPGFPGLPLAIARPEARVDLVESASRKCAVIDRLAAAAGVGNARSVHSRVEDWARGAGGAAYDLATARAVASLAVLVEYAAPLLAVGGHFVAWKGSVGSSERAAGDAAAAELGLELADLTAVHPYEAARALHLYVYSKVRETPARYPRKPGIAAKRPLGAKNLPGPPLT